MELDIEPIIDNWYLHLDKGQEFKVVAIDEDSGLIEIQHYDGDIEEVSLSEWSTMPLEICEDPQSWAGVLDISELDDFGTEVTDTAKEDWDDSLSQFKAPKKEKLT